MWKYLLSIKSLGYKAKRHIDLIRNSPNKFIPTTEKPIPYCLLLFFKFVRLWQKKKQQKHR